MRRLLFVVLTFVAAAATAAEPRRYAAMSLLGSELELVVLQGWKTGSNLPNVRREKVKLTDNAIDRVILLKLDDLLHGKQPDSKLTMMVARDPGLYATQDQILDARIDLDDLVPQVQKLAGPLNVTHVILVTKYRHEALLRLADSSTGDGMLSGIGFYIDYNKKLIDQQTGEKYIGYLAAYAYFRVSVIDLAAQKIVRDERVMGSYVHPASTATRVVHPWESATETQKSQMLQRVLRTELDRVVPALLRE